MAITEAKTKFPSAVANEIFNKVTGKSSLSKLSGRTPIKFNGTDLFVFGMDGEVNIVGEGEKNEAGGITFDPVTMKPVMVDYGARVSDRFMIASEEEQLDILKEFNEGFGAKLGRGLDIMAMHGINPRSKSLSPSCTTYFDKEKTQVVNFDASKADDNVTDAVEKLGDIDVTGICMSKQFSSALGKLTDKAGNKLYPELRWGAQPETINGLNASINSTVSYGDGKDYAIVGDFANAFKWGLARDITFEVIPYGDPDGTGKDLKAYNQVYIRGFAYIGWGILNDKAFARVVAPEAP